ncbi:transcription factor 19 [Polymixia lowei]
MLSGVQPCFQLLRIGSSEGDSARDLYTFRPALRRSVFRLGRASELCDVTLDSTSVSRIHAELHAEREGSEKGEGGPPLEEGWSVHIKDRSSHGTWVNEVRLQPSVQWELSDGDTLTFGSQSAPGSPEFYFLFQKVKVRPLDFDAITIPKAGTFSSDIQNRIRTSLDQRAAADGLSKLSINRATVILNSIGSLSKMKGSAWTFKRGDGQGGNASDPSPSSSPPLATGFSALLPPSTPPSFPTAGSMPSVTSLPVSSRSRRKSAHTVLLEDDSSDEPRSRERGGGGAEDGQRAQGRKRRRLYKSESEGFNPPPVVALQYKSHDDVRRPFEAKPFPVGTRTIGSYHGAVTNSKLNQHYQQHQHGHQHGHQTAFGVSHKRDTEALHIRMAPRANLPVFRQQKAFSSSPAQRGRRRAHSSPVFSPLVVGGENYSLASPSMRICTAEERGRVQFNRFHLPTGKRRGRPRKHPLPPRPSLPSPSSSSSSSSSTSSASSSSSSSSSSSEEDDDEEEEEEGAAGAVEPCAALRCRLPQQDTVQWIQCDVCDAWYHIDCLHVDRKKLLLDPNADFHCGCR